MCAQGRKRQFIFSPDNIHPLPLSPPPFLLPFYRHYHLIIVFSTVFMFTPLGLQVTFIPKCDRSSGAWLAEQCLEELGVCWCVTPHGDQVPGSLTRGAPQCQGTARAARRMSFDPATPTNMSESSGLALLANTIQKRSWDGKKLAPMTIPFGCLMLSALNPPNSLSSPSTSL